VARGGQGEGAVEQRQRPRKKGFLVCCFGSSMKKCFALTKTFGLTPFACAPWHRPPGLATPFPSHSTPSAAKRPGAQRRGKRGALRREADFTWTEWGGEGVKQRKEAGGRRPPASFKTSPLPRLDPLPQSRPHRGRGGVGADGPTTADSKRGRSAIGSCASLGNATRGGDAATRLPGSLDPICVRSPW
jgi:hypothetical protein